MATCKFLLLLTFLHACSSLESQAKPQFISVISVPFGNETETSENVSEIIPEQEEEGVTVTMQQVTMTKTKVGNNTFPGIRDKVQEEPLSNRTRVQVNIRGKAGLVRENSEADVPIITWAQAQRQVKRPFIPRRVGGDRHRIFRITNATSTLDDPPPHEEVAKMARFVVHNSNWTSMATISTRDPIVGFPFANVFSVSDGPLSVGGNKGTGIPYMFMTPLDISVIDLQKNIQCSLTMTLAQGDYCRARHWDPEDPRCARVILTGNMIKFDNSSIEASQARRALFSRHPDMRNWPKDHGWFFAKLEIRHILVLDYFGGAKTVSVDEYFSAN